MTDMKKFYIALGFLFAAIAPGYTQQGGTVTISGRVTDFEGSPKDSSVVELIHPHWDTAFSTYTDRDGYYSLEVEKGKYMAMYVLREEEYPSMNAVPPEDMRLEFWGWNIIADRDMVINPRYHKLELYGTTVFQVYGGYPGFFVYFRPMSLTKSLEYPEELYLDKETAEKETVISVKPEYLKVRVYADDEELKINSIHHLEEYTGDENMTTTGYVVQVEMPAKRPDKPYIVFRVVAENTEDGETGENIYFYELPNFK